MDIPQQADVVVIGGGPAGSMAATYLAQKGYKVVLLEKAKHPRYVVGESLIPHFWKYCDLAGVTPKMEADGFVKKSGGTQVWNGVIRQLTFKDFGHARGALHVERDRFDKILIDNARDRGAQVFEEVLVSDVDLKQADKVEITYRRGDDKNTGRISCRFVVDASGQSAIVARQLGVRVIDEGFRFMSAWGYFQNSKYVASDGRAYPFEKRRETPPTTFVSSFGDWGWAWHIVLRDTTSVGLVIPVEAVKEIKTSDEALEKYFLRQCAETPYLNRLLENAKYEGQFHVVRDYSYRPSKLAGPGFFLVGDAAAFVDPIFAIGIVLGMYSAFLASWAIDSSFKNMSRVEQYQAIFASQFQGRLELTRSLALPRYGVGEGSSDIAKRTVQFQQSLEQELMYVVAVMTTRSENFMDLAQNQKITSQKFTELPEIAF